MIFVCCGANCVREHLIKVALGEQIFLLPLCALAPNSICIFYPYSHARKNGKYLEGCFEFYEKYFSIKIDLQI
jgi:hypothetical protein